MNTHQLILNSFPRFLKIMELFKPPIHNLYNRKQLNFYEKGDKTYMGSHLCGLSCFLIKCLLDKHNIPNQVIKNKTNLYIDNEFIQDHIYILLDNEIIIDPSYRQFYMDERTIKRDPYLVFVFETIEPFYIGDKETLKDLNQCVVNFNKFIYGKSFIDVNKLNRCLPTNIQYEKKETLVTHKFTYDYFIKHNKNLENFELIKYQIKNTL